MQHRVRFIFYGNLVDFLPAGIRDRESHTILFNGTPAVKDSIESAGIPHPEICCITIEGLPAPLSRKVQGDLNVEVYPFDFLKRPPPESRRKAPPGRPTFVVDENLGKLSRKLRLLGFDTLVFKGADDSVIAQTGAAHDRIILTRDKDLLKHKIIEYGYWVRNELPPEQIVEVSRRYDLIAQFAPFSICIRCNAPIAEVDRDEVYERLLPVAREKYKQFYQCTGCSQIFWKGPHYEKMARFVEELKRACRG